MNTTLEPNFLLFILGFKRSQQEPPKGAHEHQVYQEMWNSPTEWDALQNYDHSHGLLPYPPGSILLLSP